jgi:hypothetical protein
MIDALYPIWGIILIGFVIALLDWLGRRKYRQSKQR